MHQFEKLCTKTKNFLLCQTHCYIILGFFFATHPLNRLIFTATTTPWPFPRGYTRYVSVCKLWDRRLGRAAASRCWLSPPNQEERPERAYTASGPSHRPPTVKWPKEAPNAGEQAKKLAEFAASREAAKAVKVAKRARADREKFREQKQLRNLAIGHAILDDQ